MEMGSVIVENGKEMLTIAKCFAEGHLRFVNDEWRDDNGNAIEISRVRHGRWIDAYPDIEPNPMFMYGICSECGFEQGISKYLNYCPNCGSKMDRGDGNSDMT